MITKPLTKKLEKICRSETVQNLLSELFPFKNGGIVESPLGLARTSLGYDPSTREYIQPTWLDKQLDPLHIQDILWHCPKSK